MQALRVNDFFLLSRQNFVIPPCDITCTMPSVKQPQRGTFKPWVGQSLSSAWLSIPPGVILSINFRISRQFWGFSSAKFYIFA